MEKVMKELCAASGIYMEARKNTILNSDYQDDRNACVYYLLDGICALTGYSKSGAEHVFLYLLPERLVGFNPYVSGGSSKYYAYSGPFIQTKTDCRMYKIPKNAFLNYLNTNLEFNQYMVRLLSENYHHTLAHFKQVQEESSVTVICRFLMSMYTETSDGPVLPRFFTHDEISKYLGLHIVTVSKIMLKLKSMGYIEKLPCGVLLKNLDGIKEMIQDCRSFKY